MRYVDVASELRARLAAGDFRPGGPLPSEAELGEELGASRVTVRRALEALKAEGLVTSRRGSGWFVAHDPVRQSLGRVTTVEAALEAAGAVPSRKVLEFAFEPASNDVAAALDLARGAEVLRVRRLNLADDRPFAIVTVWVAANLGRHLSRADVEMATFYDLLPFAGVEFGRAQQIIGADVATADDARLLEIERGDPVLTCRRLTLDAAGRPVLLAEHRYAGVHTTFEVELPSVTSPRAQIGARP
jgi:GntR family transcriptional regulator